MGIHAGALADTIPGACARLGIARSSLYIEISEGRLRAVKMRGRTLITVNEPYRKDAVVAFLKSAEKPLLLREVAEGCAIQLSSANRVLLRLHADGQATRHQLPIQRPAYCHKRKAVVPGGARRMLYVYNWVGQRRAETQSGDN